MLVGPLWFGEHGGMFLVALAADDVFAKRFIRPAFAALKPVESGCDCKVA